MELRDSFSEECFAAELDDRLRNLSTHELTDNAERLPLSFFHFLACFLIPRQVLVQG